MSDQTKIKHPCVGRSKAAVAAFEAIATGQIPRASCQTMKALEGAGLIRQIGKRMLPGEWPLAVPVYEVPLGVHMQWCEWASENCPDE